MLVQTDTDIILERLDLFETTTYYDNYSYFIGSNPTTFCGSNLPTTNCIDTVGGELGHDWFLAELWCKNCLMFVDPITPPIDKITGLERFNGTSPSLSLDGLYQGEFAVTNGEMAITRAFTYAQVGTKFLSELKTLPIASPQGPIELNHKRIIKVQLYLYESAGFYIDGDFVSNDLWDVAKFNEKSTEQTGVYDWYALGWDTLKDYTIHSDDPYGFNVLKTGTYIDASDE